MRRSVGLAQFMAIVGVLAIGLAMMKAASGPLARGVVLASVAGLLFATLGSLVRMRRAAWTGFALFGWGYLLVAAGVPYLIGEANNEGMFDIGQVDGGVRALADRFHPESTAPIDPFPDYTIDYDPPTATYSKVLNGQQTPRMPAIPLTPAETTLQLAFDAQSAIQLHRKEDAARQALVIGLTIQGLDFALIGSAAGHALSDRSANAGASPGAGPSTLPG